MWKASSALEKEGGYRSVAPEQVSDLRIVPLSASNCPLIVRLASEQLAMMIVTSTFETVTLDKWITIPRSIQQPIVEIMTADEQTLNVEDKDSSIGEMGVQTQRRL